MISKQLLKIKSHLCIAQDTFEVVLHSPLARELKPGQFIHIALKHHMLRRPVSVANVDVGAETFTIVFKIFGEGTRALSNCKAGGDFLDAILPCGSYYPIDRLQLDHALIVGGGIGGVPPLYYLAQSLKKKGVQITSVLGFQTKSHVFYEDKFQLLGDTYVATNDGTYGAKGFVTDIITELSTDIDYYFACGPTAMLKAVTDQLETQEGYISLEERMGCGVGTCYACVVPLKEDPSKSKKICKDGPVFYANEVILP
ncbi:dihydroorotate dehydrogenase electron transfer subunit [Gracilibacillus boraciitolerans JCM 21714]|uniref:Dihydroorotate dehydrogenase B (NAD(+)), electron transfer subunit n=1 Tax=Gracilibacillus boraciitolerans JCM 21714 TaxID=1298598 RepID=W4VG08_9BACI|nr:dihydroorotate dehydrogenase electron transfer subunit [Gracilibacillus boraciitolerans]GAE91699.1 dihydroorotate dehydrogenase electron transfer subunit [Gracilibacillus boraciitolerans JCM 21714]